MLASLCRKRSLLAGQITLILMAIFGWIGGCTTVSDGIQDNADGREFRAEFCDSVLTFIRAPLDSEGLRRAWFLPFGTSDEWIDFYAPMTGNPPDDAASAFYEQRVGQLTHYATKPGFASAIAKCLTADEGFSRRSYILSNDQMRGSFKDKRLGRRIEIYAVEQVAGILVADSTRKGDLEEVLLYESVYNVDE